MFAPIAGVPHGAAVCRTASPIGRPAGVVDDVRPGALVARRVRFDHIPVEQREDFVKAGVTVQSVLLKMEKLPSR